MFACRGRNIADAGWRVVGVEVSADAASAGRHIANKTLAHPRNKEVEKQNHAVGNEGQGASCGENWGSGCRSQGGVSSVKDRDLKYTHLSKLSYCYCIMP